MVLVVHSVTDGEQLNVNLPPADHPLSTQLFNVFVMCYEGAIGRRWLMRVHEPDKAGRLASLLCKSCLTVSRKHTRDSLNTLNFPVQKYETSSGTAVAVGKRQNTTCKVLSVSAPLLTTCDAHVRGAQGPNTKKIEKIDVLTCHCAFPDFL